jgi:hypothetical protein
MGSVVARTRALVALGTVVMLVVVGVATFLVDRNAAAIAMGDARVRAARGVDLLAEVGAGLPRLTRPSLATGPSPAEVRVLDAAVKRAQSAHLLADLVIWDATGRVVYSSLDAIEGTRPPIEPAVAAALAGKAVTRTQPRELDQSSGKRTGVLEDFEPLLDDAGVYGAMEASLPLKPIEAATKVRDRSTLLFAGSGLLIWLLLMPVWVRLARSQASEWIPGRRRTIRAVRAALDRDEIKLAYQPQIEPGSGRLAGVEALVRWHRDGELVGPDRFLPAVELSALMPRLTDRVLDLALAQLAAWRSAGIVTRVAVNLSPTDLADKALGPAHCREARPASDAG